MFIAIIALSAGQLFLLERATERFTDTIGECVMSVNSDSFTYERLSELDLRWEEYRSRVSFLTRSDTLADMAADIARLRSMTDPAELTGELESLRTRARFICEEQLPRPSSIF